MQETRKPRERPKVLAQNIQYLPGVEPYILATRLVARRHLRDVRLEFGPEKLFYLGAHARIVREFAPKEVGHAEQEVEPADGSGVRQECGRRILVWAIRHC